ncbi:MAG TPA: polyprenyl synthetase family protein [Bellilinea sp.]|nr:polyprenyl synthetase family protein [Bellilinea sp.]
MKLNEFSEKSLQAVETAIETSIQETVPSEYTGMREMIAYQFGYDQPKTTRRTGKYIRPLLCLLTAAATGGQWESAVPAAASLEMIHNFTLIHDDIEDKSDTRRGRPTTWKKFGVPLAINAGDALYALALVNLGQLDKYFPPEIEHKVAKVLHSTVLSLCGGQHLDIQFEEASQLPLDSYWSMIAGKTGRLIIDSMQVGAICSNSPEGTISDVKKLGHYVGLGFQIQDDYLGIWGDTNATGKSITSDLTEGKKSFPIITGLQMKGRFAANYPNGKVDSDEITAAIKSLELDGVNLLTQEQIKHTAMSAQSLLNKMDLKDPYKAMFRELIDLLIQRKA